MFISSDSEQIYLGPDSGQGSLTFSSMTLDPDSPSLPTIYTDISVVPEQEKDELERLISNLEGEVEQLKLKQRLFDEKRREALNQILDVKGSIRVFCRVRPFLAKERSSRILESVSTGCDTVVVKSSAVGNKDFGFGFDMVFDPATNQEDVFAEVKPILRSGLDGHNVCIFAYGQTGTGKTFTMEGTNAQPGIVPRALKELFDRASSDNSSPVTFSMSLSMLEVYMGNVKDLLAPKREQGANRTISRSNLNIQTDPKGNVDIENLTEVPISDFASARMWYAKGKRVRSTSRTNVNDASSRSHCLTRVTISRDQNVLGAKVEVSKLWMIDLGGSERLLKTGATGMTLDEGRAINLSLSALADVIAALRRKRGHVPYRNSKLTQILKDSLGNDSKALMLVHISPSKEDVNETICSLNFATRARGVESCREVPEDLKNSKAKLIAQLEEDMRGAEEDCKAAIDQLQRTDFLLKQSRKLYATSYGGFTHNKDVKATEEVAKEDIAETPRTSERTTKRTVSGFVPRFMTATVASSQRQTEVEREVAAKARRFRSGTGSSVQLLGSQSLGLSGSRLRASLTAERCNGLDLKKTSLPRNKTVTASDPNLRLTLPGLQRRRMSELV